MADNLTRKYLSSLNLEQNVIDAIIEAHASTVDALTSAKAELEALRAENGKLKQNATDAATEKARADKAVKELEDFKLVTAANEKRGKVREAYKGLLRAANIDEKRLDTVLKVTDLDKLTLKEDGTLDGADKLTEAIQTEWADFVTTESKNGSNPATPPGGSGSEAENLAAIRAAMGLPPKDGGK